MGNYVNSGIKTNNFDSPVITSLSNQVLMNNGFTEKQNALANKLCRKYLQQLNTYFKQDITQFLDNPANKISLRVFSQERSIKIATADHVKYFEIKFPYDRMMIEKLRSFKNNNQFSYSVWNDAAKTWRLSFDEGSMKFILENLSDYSRDEETESLFNQYNDIYKTFKDHIPMLVKNDSVYTFTNTKFGIETDDLTTALTELRKRQFTVIDDNVLHEIEDLPVSDITKVMLAMPETVSFQTKKDKLDHAEILKTVLVHDAPVGIVMTDTATPESLTAWIDAANSLGITTEQMGVYFRQENTSPNQKQFNSIIKEHLLNKPVTKSLRIYFLGTKYNKSLLKEGINLRYYILDDHYVSAHHNMQVMLTNALLKVYYLTQDKQLGDDVVVM
jgi:hypothetical protein